jgi:hypothetical protein
VVREATHVRVYNVPNLAHDEVAEDEYYRGVEVSEVGAGKEKE